MADKNGYALAALRRTFGYGTFRPGQEEAVDAIVSGRDVMAVMPTGGGKSICYQLPAARPGTFTLVVTPLRALMRDQVRHLDEAGVPAALIDSGVDEHERAGIYAKAIAGGLRILYVAPERLHTPDFADFTRHVRIDLLAVDEAHCVLQWGGDFRPSYMRIGEYIRGLEPRPVVIALTATASRTQADEIIGLLGLHDPARIATDADRPNLHLSVVRARPRERAEAIIRWARTHQGSGIIYKENRKGCEQLAATLRAEGVDAAAFHAEMGDADKKKVQDGFLSGSPRVICATSAFGMGVDKPDVRWVLNDGPCKSPEAYWQEAGRAGRDGLPAEAVLYWSPGDWRWLRRAAWEARSRAEESGDPARIHAAELMDARLDAMDDYCQTSGCLRAAMLAIFDPPGTRRPDCRNCGNCETRTAAETGRTADSASRKAARRKREDRRTRARTGESTPMDREAISAACTYIENIRRTLGHGVRPSVLAAALHGSTRHAVTEQGLELIEGHGAFAGRSRPAVRGMIATLEAIQAIDTRTGTVEPGPLFDLYMEGK